MYENIVYVWYFPFLTSISHVLEETIYKEKKRWPCERQ